MPDLSNLSKLARQHACAEEKLGVPIQGAVGLFVKSGSVSIRRLIVSD